jgi:hypothetical protein
LESEQNFEIIKNVVNKNEKDKKEMKKKKTAKKRQWTDQAYTTHGNGQPGQSIGIAPRTEETPRKKEREGRRRGR